MNSPLFQPKRLNELKANKPSKKNSLDKSIDDFSDKKLNEEDDLSYINDSLKDLGDSILGSSDNFDSDNNSSGSSQRKAKRKKKVKKSKFGNMKSSFTVDEENNSMENN